MSILHTRFKKRFPWRKRSLGKVSMSGRRIKYKGSATRYRTHNDPRKHKKLLRQMGYKINPRRKSAVLLQSYKNSKWQTLCTMTDMTDAQCRNNATRYHATHPNEKLRLVRANASIPHREVAQAKKLFEEFAGKPAGKVTRVRINVPKAGLAFGELLQIGYRSSRDGQPYRHTFRKKTSRPLLTASSDGKQLLIVGGRYNFTDRGIEDA